MQVLRRVLGVIDAINKHWGAFVGLFVIPIALVMFYEVVARYIFDAPTVWANQLAQLIFGGFIVMGGAYALLHNAHTRMDLIYSRMPSDRVRAIVDLITSGLFFLFCGLLLYYALPHCWNLAVTGARVHSLLWHVVVWPTYLCLPLAVFLLLLQGLAKFVRDLNTAISGKPGI